MFKRLLAAAVPVLLAATPLGGADRDRAVMIAQIVDGAREDNGDIWFTTWDQGVGFFLTPAGDEQARAIFDELRAAADASLSFTVRFDAGSGELLAGKTYVRFRACSIAFEAASFALHGGACDSSAAAPAGDAVGALALGVAAAAGGDPGAAVPLLTAALSDAGLSREGQIIALRAREAAARDRAAGTSPAMRDRGLIVALADARRWAGLAPDDVDARLIAAADLSSLGAYDEAIAAYQAIVERWPDEDYRVSVRIGAIHRALGDDAKALAALDGLVARHGPQPGMKFHYHRGWTLTNLDRNEEAVAELDEGLKQQPDYTWAHVRRACALGKLGRIAAAAADQRRGLALFERSVAAQAKPDAVTLRSLARARRVAADLEGLVRTHPNGMTPVACTGYPDEEAKRARSPLLSPSSA